MIKYNNRITTYIFICMIYLLLQSSISAQITDKRGGIGFRVGGNQSITDLNNYAALFDTYGYKFAFAMGLGESEFNSQTYIDGVKALQANGHELFDLTPNFRINYFITKFNPTDYTVGASVDHVNGTKICLKFDNVNILNKVHTGTVNININNVTGTFNGFGKTEYYLYFSAPLDTLVLISSISIDSTSIIIKDVWDDAIDLGSHTNITYYSFDYKGIHMTPEALELLGNETLKLATLYGIGRPYRWITPGTANTPWGATPTEIKSTLGDVLGYISAQAYVDYSLKTYNEYDDPVGTRRFGMTWGNFYEETKTLAELKETIADGIAKHYVLFNHGHFLGSYLANTSAILQWCNANNIPVLTATEWSNILYSTTQDESVNVFPPLNVDLDGNGVPDGYSKTYSNGTLITNDGPSGSGNVSYSIDNTATDSRICYISGLGGVEKGENAFEIWTKGDVNNQVTVYFSATGMTTQSFTFPANTLDWTKYDLSQTVNGNNSLNIPVTVSKVNISIYGITPSGEVRIGGMTLKKYIPTPVELTSFIASVSDLGVELEWTTATEVNNYGFEIERASSPLSTSLTEGVSEWETIGFVNGHGNSYSPKEYSFIDTSSINGEVNYRLKQIDTDGTFEYSDVVTINFSITSVDPSEITETNLDQNHPNPFNPSTIISYQLTNPTNVSLKVFDIIGNEVATLINNEKQGAGIHSVEFNKTNFNISSGVYFYQLIAGRYIKTKKMLLLK